MIKKNTPLFREKIIDSDQTLYPKDRKLFEQTLLSVLPNSLIPAPHSSTLKALIIPHAPSSVISSVAGLAYQHIQQKSLKKIILLAQAHNVYFEGLAYHDADYFVSPFGKIAIDKENLELILPFPQISCINMVFEKESAIEAQLPFIQILFPEAKVLPLLVGDANIQDIKEILSLFMHQPDCLIIISSNLSRGQDEEQMRSVDLETAQMIEHYDFENINSELACGSRAIKGLLSLCYDMNSSNSSPNPSIQIQTIKLSHSMEIEENPKKKVGYGVFAFYQKLH